MTARRPHTGQMDVERQPGHPLGRSEGHFFGVTSLKWPYTYAVPVGFHHHFLANLVLSEKHLMDMVQLIGPRLRIPATGVHW